MKNVRKIITIERSIEVDDYLRNFIFHNINYRRKIWNLFVEEYNKTDGRDFNINETISRLCNTIDKDVKCSSDYYCSDIVKMVGADVFEAFKRVIHDAMKDHREHRLRFKRFDRYYGAVKVRTCSFIWSNSGNLMGRVHIRNKHTFEFRPHRHNKFDIHLTEKLYDDKDFIGYYYTKTKTNAYCFTDTDIKEIYFKHELGKFYIGLIVEVSYDNKKKEYNKRKDLCGIDLGIHNPISVCYEHHDTHESFKIYQFGMPEDVLRKIHYLERKARRYQHVMTYKFDINVKRGLDNPYSHNYEKIRKKFRKTWRQIRNIKRHWRRVVSKIIATNFKVLVVDEFKTPDKKVHEGLPSCVVRKLNHYNRIHSMYLFMETLRHACCKYNTKYIEAPKGTTRTCCECGHKNPKLPLNTRYLICEECGLKIDRDRNAAINCFNSYKNHH